MTDGVRRPDMRPRRKLFWTALAAFAGWVGVLTWLYVSQVVMKRV